ncbi:MAG: sulfatase [Planctomycetaceae bacterium]
MSPVRLPILMVLLFAATIVAVLSLQSVKADQDQALARRQRPNVVIILADDLGAGDLSCLGAQDMRTPHIDGLFARGLQFTNFSANSSVCSPTRAALLTGCYPDLVGVPGVIRTHPENNWGYLRPDAVLLPKIMADAGYQTALVGKWHLGLESPNRPNERGFAHFHGFLGDMMDDYYLHRRHDINYMMLNEKSIEPEGHATDLFTTWACDYLRSTSKEQPFLLYLAYNAPHSPIQPPEDWLTRVKEREKTITEKRAKLVALIEHLDNGVGQVLKTLADTGRDRDTLIVFTSDNGGPLNFGATNGSLRDGKGSMYEGGLKVPTCIVWPGNTEPGTTDFAAMSMDLFPTILDAAGIGPKHKIDGASFLSTLVGWKKQEPLREQWFFLRREGGQEFAGKTIEAVRLGDWKLLQNSPFAPQELYNLRTDPGETTNVIAKERGVAQNLAAALRRHNQRAGAVPWQREAK